MVRILNEGPIRGFMVVAVRALQVKTRSVLVLSQATSLSMPIVVFYDSKVVTAAAAVTVYHT